MVGAAITGLGWLVKELRRSWREAREGRKDEAQKIAAERDEWKKRAGEWKREAEALYNRKQRVKDVLYATRQVAMVRGKLSVDELPPVPPDQY